MNHKILLADDDPDIREVVPLVLEPYGFQTIVAGNGAEGLRLVQDDREIELILVDLMMPLVSGVDMVVHLKEDPALRKIPIVVLSGENSAGETALLLGATACLRKPVELSILISTIEGIIRQPRS
jgi:CheY-like chemotaxis protein